MYPNKINTNYMGLGSQKGLGLPLAIFIILIMSLIAVAVNKISESSAESYIQSLLTSRVFYAAESGIQLKLNAVLGASPCVCGATSQSFDFSSAGLSGCTAEVTCSSFTLAGGSTYCTLTSQGSCIGSDAQRTVEVRVK